MNSRGQALFLTLIFIVGSEAIRCYIGNDVANELYAGYTYCVSEYNKRGFQANVFGKIDETVDTLKMVKEPDCETTINGGFEKTRCNCYKDSCNTPQSYKDFMKSRSEKKEGTF
ncbi:unnamed protein product [Caenorhabditis sp. 36 PRJEB53466]|nr:unnamed protein product [Caenorhabditis sp. 36 PRJEB53466]